MHYLTWADLPTELQQVVINQHDQLVKEFRHHLGQYGITLLSDSEKTLNKYYERWFYRVDKISDELTDLFIYPEFAED